MHSDHPLLPVPALSRCLQAPHWISHYTIPLPSLALLHLRSGSSSSSLVHFAHSSDCKTIYVLSVQIFGYLMISAGSAGSGVTNLNKTGIRHTPLPDFCKTLSYFCNHVALSLLLVFLSFIFLASSSLFNVVLLSTL